MTNNALVDQLRNSKKSWRNLLREPLIKALKDMGGAGKPKQIKQHIIKSYNLPKDITEKTRGKQGKSAFYNELYWSRQELVESGFLDRSEHGIWKLTEKGAWNGG
jgi:hypothetical protein